MTECLLLSVTVLMLKTGLPDVIIVPIVSLNAETEETRALVASLQSDPVPMIDESTGDFVLTKRYECAEIATNVSGNTSAP